MRKTFRQKTTSFILAFLIVFQTVTGIFLPVNFSAEPPFLESQNADAADDWYETAGWGYRKKITIDHDKVANDDETDQLNFPVLINRTDDDWRHTDSDGKVEQTNGGDFLFTSSNGTTKLLHEIESYNAVTGELQAWVKIPILSASVDTEIYLYYGNSSCDDQWDVPDELENVWDANFEMVQHMDDATTSTITDSTANANNGTKKAANEPIEAAGQINKAQSFDGVDDFVDCGNDESLDITEAITIEAWFYQKSQAEHKGIVSKWGSISDSRSWYFLTILDSGNSYIRMKVQDASNVEYTAQDPSPISLNTWYHVVGVYNGSDIILALA